MGRSSRESGYLNGRRLARLDVRTGCHDRAPLGIGPRRWTTFWEAATHRPRATAVGHAHALQAAWYQVREGEAQVFYGLADARQEPIHWTTCWTAW